MNDWNVSVPFGTHSTLGYENTYSLSCWMAKSELLNDQPVLSALDCQKHIINAKKRESKFRHCDESCPQLMRKAIGWLAIIPDCKTAGIMGLQLGAHLTPWGPFVMLRGVSAVVSFQLECITWLPRDASLSDSCTSGPGCFSAIVDNHTKLHPIMNNTPRLTPLGIIDAH